MTKNIENRESRTRDFVSVYLLRHPTLEAVQVLLEYRQPPLVTLFQRRNLLANLLRLLDILGWVDAVARLGR